MITFSKSEADTSTLSGEGRQVRIAAHLSIEKQAPIEVSSVLVSSPEDADRKVPEMLRELADHLEQEGPFYRLTADLFD